jgi:hypothetical protein
MKIQAKGKKRRTELKSDAELEKSTVVPKRGKQEQGSSAVPTREVINIMADVIQSVYEEFGGRELDRENAKDKALILFRSLLYEDGGTRISEHSYIVRLCEEHSHFA